MVKKQWRTWKNSGVDCGLLTGKLPRTERETVISFYEYGTKTGEIQSANPKWHTRLESLGVSPISIMRFEGDKAEIRYYDSVPKIFIKLPSSGKRGTKPVRKNRLKPAQWKKKGVEVIHTKGYTIDKDERETAVNFLESDKTANVYTSNTKWQNRIESLGITPYRIYTYKGTNVDQREYEIPVGYIKLPSDGRRTKK